MAWAETTPKGAGPVRSVGAHDAKTHLVRLPDGVATGQPAPITRHGAPVAMLVPVPRTERREPRQAIDGLHRFRRGISLRGLSHMLEAGRRGCRSWSLPLGPRGGAAGMRWTRDPRAEPAPPRRGARPCHLGRGGRPPPPRRGAPGADRGPEPPVRRPAEQDAVRGGMAGARPDREQRPGAGAAACTDRPRRGLPRSGTAAGVVLLDGPRTGIGRVLRPRHGARRGRSAGGTRLARDATAPTRHGEPVPRGRRAGPAVSAAPGGGLRGFPR